MDKTSKMHSTRLYRLKFSQYFGLIDVVYRWISGQVYSKQHAGTADLARSKDERSMWKTENSLLQFSCTFL